MKRLVAYLVLLCLSAGGLHAQDLDGKLDEYLSAIAGENIKVKEQECDFLITTCKDSLVRQKVTLKIYDHYLLSKVMGDENVAVYVAEKWLLDGPVAFMNEEDRLNAKVFVTFNKNSLIGMKAPDLTLKTPEGESLSPLENSRGRYAVLYFYDTGCATCRIETVRLREWLKSEESEGVDFYGVYTGTDEASWARYRGLQLPEGIHLWDPSLDSNYQMDYGILQTPSMFLIGPDGKIAGRRLDTPALKQLLSSLRSSEAYVYGEPDAMALFEELFSMEDGSADAVGRVADYLALSTLPSGDSLSYRHLCGDLLYYLSSSEGQGMKEGTLRFINDRLSGVGMDPEIEQLAAMMKGLLSRTPVGEKLPAIAIHGTFYRRPCFIFPRRPKEGKWRLDRLGRKARVVFYAPGCRRCEELLRDVAGSRDNILLIDMDALFSSWPDEATAALDTFDLSALPFILEVDCRGRVIGKYL